MRAGDGVQSRAAEILGLRRNVFKYKWDRWATVSESELSMRLSVAVPAGGDLNQALSVFEEESLRRALVVAKGVQSKAADLLGLKRSVMPYKLKKYPALAAAPADEAGVSGERVKEAPSGGGLGPWEEALSGRAGEPEGEEA
jgi:DNA-binding protein Fis